jgi:hypothetical protein
MGSYVAYILLLNWDNVENAVGFDVFGPFTMALLASITVVYIIAVIKRGNDINKTGGILALAFLPYINIIFWFYLASKGGKRRKY